MKNIGCSCKASEIGKLVINKCIDRQIPLTNIKLQKLLIIMQGVMIASHNRILFKENLTNSIYGLSIQEVSNDFSQDKNFVEKYMNYIVPLEKEVKIIDRVLTKYGHLDSFELKTLPEMQELYEILKNFNFKTSSAFEKIAFASSFKDNILVWELGLEEKNQKVK